MKPAAFSGDYTDLKFIKSRKVAVISIEIAIEQAATFVAAFGTPNPATGIPVAIARLDPTKAASESARPQERPTERERQKWSMLPPAKQAAIRCGDTVFERFLAEKYSSAESYGSFNNPDAVVVMVRELCGVSSRADILEGTRAAIQWRKLDDEFLAWKAVG